jgi:hypothetical protein
MKRRSFLNTPHQHPVRCPARHALILAKVCPCLAPRLPDTIELPHSFSCICICICICSYLAQREIQWPTGTALAAYAHVLGVFRGPSASVWQKQHEPEPLPSGPRRRPTSLRPTFYFFLRLHTGYGEAHATSDRTRRRPWGSWQTCNVSGFLTTTCNPSTLRTISSQRSSVASSRGDAATEVRLFLPHVTSNV